jgi:hypothetical protein
VDVRKPNSIRWYRRGVLLEVLGSPCSDRAQQQCWYVVRLSTGGRMLVRHHQLRTSSLLDKLALET